MVTGLVVVLVLVVFLLLFIEDGMFSLGFGDVLFTHGKFITLEGLIINYGDGFIVSLLLLLFVTSGSPLFRLALERVSSFD